MRIELSKQKTMQRIFPNSLLDYSTFIATSRDSQQPRELKAFEKFIVAGMLTREGYSTYLNPTLRTDDNKSIFEADGCGVRGDELIIAFCPTTDLDEKEWSVIRKISNSSNAKALLLSPHGIDRMLIEKHVPGSLQRKKLRIETLGWFEDSLEHSLQETLRTIELLVNETRMRMMAPRLQKAVFKKDLRARINPKLVYQNLSALSGAGLVEEPVQGKYELSQLGEMLLAEFIAFLERTRRTLDYYKDEEVKSIGRR